VTTYFVSSVDGSNSDNGTSWALAVATLKYAVETLAASSGPHTIKVDSAHADALGADTTITAAQDLQIISVNRAGGDAPLAGAVIGSQATNYQLSLNGAKKVFWSGITFKTGTNTSGDKSMFLCYGVDGGCFVFDDCDFHMNAGNGQVGSIYMGSPNAGDSSAIKFQNGCTFKFSQTDQRVLLMMGNITFESFTVDPAGSAISPLFPVLNNPTATFEGCDLSKITGTLFGDGGGGYGKLTLTNCKLGSGVTIQAEPSSGPLHTGNIEVFAFNCNAGDVHYSFYHNDAFGTTTVSNTIHANDGASYDGTNRCSWQITTRASNCSFYTPYVSPWIEMYNADVATSITPYLEGLRDGSATVIQDDEVWAEFSRQGTSGSPLAVFSNYRMALLGTPANQTSTFGAGDWTGEGGTFSTFKLQAPSAFTPAEIGPLKARVIVGEPGLTIYVDPQIRT
jgi:hypothetical protein